MSIYKIDKNKKKLACNDEYNITIAATDKQIEIRKTFIAVKSTKNWKQVC